MNQFLLKSAALAARILPRPIIRVIYSIKPLAGLIRKGLNEAAPSGLTEVTIAGGGLAGYRVVLDMQVDKDYWLGTYEPELQQAVHTLVPAGAVVYDVGANIGYVSLLLTKAAGETGRVYAFEALPSNVEQLRRNVMLNEMAERIIVIPKAVSGSSGRIKFLVHESGGMGKAVGSAGRENLYQEEIEVETTSLDDFAYKEGNSPPQVVKLDIEGGEVMALPGMKRLLKETRPLMLMELHGPESSQVAWDVLTESGYEICWMKNGFPVIPALKAMGWKAYILARPK